jgi:capsular exopolysaccharide synthesis family protein
MSNTQNDLRFEKNEAKDSSISLSDIIRVLRKNWILIAIVTAFIFALGAIYTFLIVKPKYKATATIKVEVPLKDNADIGDISNATVVALRYVNSVALAIKNEKIISAVAKRNEDKTTASKLYNEISTSADTTSIFVVVSVTDRDGITAIDLVNDLALEISKYSMDSTSADVSDKDRFQCSIGIFNYASKAGYASPNKRLYLIVSLLAGLVLSMVIVFIKEFASNKYQTVDEIKTLGIPVLNTLINDKSKEKANTSSLIDATPKSFEPYNRLISNVKFSNVDNPYKVLMFTSSVVNELKSTVCSNFSYTLAHNEKKVVIIDLDTRKPRIHKVFNVKKENGIVEYLSGQIKLDELIKKSSIGVDVITVGSEVSNPVTLLESQKLKELINELKETYDYVIIDTPPLTACNDAAIISKLADAIIFNIAINQGKKKEIKSSIEELLDAKANIIGINVTKANLKDRGEYYYYDYSDNK